MDITRPPPKSPSSSSCWNSLTSVNNITSLETGHRNWNPYPYLMQSIIKSGTGAGLESWIRIDLEWNV